MTPLEFCKESFETYGKLWLPNEIVNLMRYKFVYNLFLEHWKQIEFIYKHFQVMQVHINEAIEEVNKIVKKFLTPSNELKKTIYVLDQPPLWTLFDFDTSMHVLDQFYNKRLLEYFNTIHNIQGVEWYCFFDCENKTKIRIMKPFWKVHS